MRFTFSTLVMTAIVATTLATILATTATASPITSILDYQSTVSSDAAGLLDLKAELNYDSNQTGAPIAVLMHPYSGSTGHFDKYRVNAQRLRDAGFFVVSPAMRGREGSDGVRDSGGLEIYDVYDAVESVKANYGSLINSDRVYITGYSGGGGNVMSAVTKFPDYFTAASAFFGMSDYGYDTTDGWYYNGADHRTATLDADIGDPTTGNTDVIDRYHARDSNLASKNNPYTEIHLFVNNNETICPPVNDTSFKNNAVAAATTPGEFDNITVHTGVYGTYEDFDSDGVNDSNEHQWWPHSQPDADMQHSAEAWFMDRLTSGQIASPSLNSSDDLFVAGFVKTKQFSCWLGDGQNAAGELDYELSATEKSFELQIVSNNQAITGELSVDMSDMAGRRVELRLNGTATTNFGGGGVYTYEGIANGDLVELVDIGALTIDWTGDVLSDDENRQDPTTWTLDNEVYIGQTAAGTMDLDDREIVYSKNCYIGHDAEANGAVTVDGANTKLVADEKMYVGHDGNGTLSITNGATVHNDDYGMIARYATSTSTVDVDGPETTWYNGGNTYVGGYGDGTLNITNGATVETVGDYAYIGFKVGSDSTVNVDGEGSTWAINTGASENLERGLIVGNEEVGRLNITGGATVTSYKGIIGEFPNPKPGNNPDATGIGYVTIDGAGSSWTTEFSIYVGHYGEGHLEITNGGYLSTGGRAYIGTKVNAESLGTILVDGEGSVWQHRGEMYLGNAGKGTLEISNGGLVYVETSLTMGTIAAGDGEIRMSTGGMLALPGDADDSLSQFIALIGGDEGNDLFWWNDSLEDWAPLSSATFGEDYKLEYIDTVGELLEGYTVLTVGEIPDPAIPGDANHDGKVDGSDVTILANNWQKGVSDPNPESITWEMGDFNRDGKVDGSDVTILANNWQKGVSNTSTAAVPEPSVIVLLISLGLLGPVLTHRKK